MAAFTAGMRTLAQPAIPAAPPALVLIVEDGPGARGLYREYLEFCGFRVKIAAGLDAVIEAQASLPHIIVTDLATELVDAADAIRQLKAHPRTAEIPVVALSVSGEGAALARAAGADVCLTKPCVPSQVARAIRALLVWQRSRGAVL